MYDQPLEAAKRLSERGRFSEAVSACQEAVEKEPHNALAWDALGICLHQSGRAADAIEAFNQAVRLRPDLAAIRCNRGQSLYVAGRYADAWDDFGWEQPPFQCPAWDGQRLENKTILIHGLLGLGDCIQLARYLPLVRERVGRVLFCYEPRMREILSNLVDDVVQGEMPPFDCHANIMALPSLLQLPNPGDSPRPPYLFSNRQLAEKWQGQLGTLKGLVVGINWQGNPKYRRDHLRSIPFEQFVPLAQVPGVRLVSLQQGFGSEQLHKSKSRNAVLDLGTDVDRGGAFLDTAAVLDSLDLVITSDTSVAHLAGAMDRPVWLALSKDTEWRWLDSGDKTPWYPSMRIFRQQTLGDWAGVMAKMKAELRRLTTKENVQWL